MYLRMPRRLHLELTDNCNAKCPMCKRTDPNGLDENPRYVRGNELTIDNVKQWFAGTNFDNVNHCGNFGDPVIAKDVYEIVQFFATRNTTQMVHTNGSLRNTSWWERFAQIPNVTVMFGIDGIDQQSHEMYRRNTDLQKILDNAKAYNDAGGISIWQMIVFDHNKDQVDQARLMSKQLGFKSFEVLHTRRFYKNVQFDYTFKGQQYQLRKPDTSPFEPIQDLTKYDIQCKAKKSEEVYVSADGQVWPCCYITETHTMQRSAEGNSLHHQSLQSIIESSYFDNLDASFSTSPMRMCITTCGIGRSNKRVRLSN